MSIREAHPVQDAAACAAIYTPYVEDSVATFEEQPPSAQELGRRIAVAHAWLVCERDGAVVGYAYGSRHRERSAYRFAADVAVYVAAAHHGTGIGGSLYAELIARLRTAGLWTLCAGITLPNPASEALHRSFGFAPVGVYERIGWKAGGWRDVGWWQLHLRPGEQVPPTA